MQEIVTLIEQRNAIINCLDEDRQRCRGGVWGFPGTPPGGVPWGFPGVGPRAGQASPALLGCDLMAPLFKLCGVGGWKELGFPGPSSRGTLGHPFSFQGGRGR